MKIGAVEEILKNRGYENGSKYILMAQQEEINMLKKQVVEATRLMEALADTMQNVVNGTLGMKQEIMARMKRAGLGTEEDDGLGPSTHNIGN